MHSARYIIQDSRREVHSARYIVQGTRYWVLSVDFRANGFKVQDDGHRCVTGNSIPLSISNFT